MAEDEGWLVNADQSRVAYLKERAKKKVAAEEVAEDSQS